MNRKVRVLCKHGHCWEAEYGYEGNCPECGSEATANDVVAFGPFREFCYCGKLATQYVDSDSYQYQDHGQPVCDEHAEGRDPVETRIVW